MMLFVSTFKFRIAYEIHDAPNIIGRKKNEKYGEKVTMFSEQQLCPWALLVSPSHDPTLRS